MLPPTGPGAAADDPKLLLFLQPSSTFTAPFTATLRLWSIENALTLLSGILRQVDDWLQLSAHQRPSRAHSLS